MKDTCHPSAKPVAAKTCACGSNTIESEPLKLGQPGYGTHHSRLICRDCGKFNGWGRDPKVTAAVNQRAADISRLLERAVLTPWERQFLQSVGRQRHLTNNQQAVLAKIQAKANA